MRIKVIHQQISGCDLYVPLLEDIVRCEFFFIPSFLFNWLYASQIGHQYHLYGWFCCRYQSLFLTRCFFPAFFPRIRGFSWLISLFDCKYVHELQMQIRETTKTVTAQGIKFRSTFEMKETCVIDASLRFFK